MTVLVYGITGVSLVAQSVKHLPAMQETTYNAGDPGSIPESGRSPGEGNSNPLQYSCLENPMDRGAWRATVHEVARIRHDLATKPPIPWHNKDYFKKHYLPCYASFGVCLVPGLIYACFLVWG